jgi:hypothetical protein
MNPSLRFLTSMTMFLSAGLLFAVQPMLGKMMLPLVGGSPSGWLTALAFFQLALLAGYLVAHGLSRLSARGQALATVAVLAAGAVLLPPGFHAGGGENISSTGQVLWLLFKTIFVPYLGLATVSSGLQRLYAARTEGEEPYFLYAASNAGSFVGLLAYPLVVEPFLPLSVQVVVWTAGYGLLMGLIALLAWPQLTAQAKAVFEQVSSKEVITWRQRLLWVALAFVPSSLSMGLTSLVTADLGSFPLLWVIPLGLYLLTFVIAFGRNRKLKAADLESSQVELSVFPIVFLILTKGDPLSSWMVVFLITVIFFVTALRFHIQLADQRPKSDRLTEYFLWMSVGGALGGIFNAFIAPILFNQSIEFMLVLFFAMFFCRHKFSKARIVSASLASIVVLSITISLVSNAFNILNTNYLLVPILFIIPIALAGLTFLPSSLAITGVCLMVLMTTDININHPQDAQRDFYGVMRVVDQRGVDGQVWRKFMHGSTEHGIQKITPTPEINIVSYYRPVQKVLEAVPVQEVGLVGLGAGISLCVKAPDRHFTVYEIAPLVKDMAEKWFSYIQECGEPTWRIGDARIELEHDRNRRYDLLVVDAFTSDAIPTHLITREALNLYRQRLTPQGKIMFHISNRFYDLRKPLAAMAHDAHMQSIAMLDVSVDVSKGYLASQWVMLAEDNVKLEPYYAIGWKPLRTESISVWSDDFANVMATLKILASPELIENEGNHVP